MSNHRASSSSLYASICTQTRYNKHCSDVRVSSRITHLPPRSRESIRSRSPSVAPRYHGHGRSTGSISVLHRYIIIINFLFSCFIYAPIYVFGGHSYRTRTPHTLSSRPEERSAVASTSFTRSPLRARRRASEHRTAAPTSPTCTVAPSSTAVPVPWACVRENVFRRVPSGPSGHVRHRGRRGPRRRAAGARIRRHLNGRRTPAIVVARPRGRLAARHQRPGRRDGRP